ncbi:type II secretion system F family protein [Amycolatopsis sp. DSM 110486]|uniref:type II secretion system F family protein n=1 Tax=Amycolatopsis sp. DSM 110486 TaxID=2865832 RepID=UPI001C6A4E6A|nr:type II secretion system F family protein [Amycolatopsis sp. DSM 110486]QYN23610.1 type II secretion system F family protein [Amycolatopsis sp. DSM 110486]
MITAWPFLCFGTALLTWPTLPTRLKAPPRRRLTIPTPPRQAVWVLPTLLALPLAGVGAAMATALITVAARQERRSRRETSAGLARAEQTSAALRTMVAELRAGAHPVLAAEAAAEAVPALAGELTNLATAARLDGALESPELPELAAAWTLARRHGLPIADTLDATRRDVDAATLYARRLHAKMAGPRMSATVLTGLPVLCLAMGQAIGAEPLTVLTQTVLGQLFLVAGAALLWAGTAWSRVLTGRREVR